jgi:molybdate transport system ATP-binding protein
MPPSSPLLSIEDVTLQLGDRQVFAHTTWRIEKNQHWAITGPTGSGKSVLARAICRRVMLVEGQIRYFLDENQPQGRPYLYPKEILTLSAETHRAFLRQYAGYHQARWQSFEGDDVPTVASLLAPQSHPTCDPQKRDAAIDLFHLDPLLGRKILHLSYGESRKVFIAWLLIQSPHLLILDDPFSGLDQDSRKVLASGLEKLILQASPQILLISSRIEDVPTAIDHFLILENCQVGAQGSRPAPQSPSSAPSSTASFQKSPAFDAMVARYTTALQENKIFSRKVREETRRSIERAIKDEPLPPHFAPLRVLSGQNLEEFTQPELIRMTNVSVRYGQVEVLKNVNWTVRQGERWALLGHNGAGKTTLLSLILADNPQSYANDIVLFGKQRGSGESIWEIKQNIGWVSSELHIFYREAATCFEVVCSGFFDAIDLSQRCTPSQLDTATGWMRAFEIETLAELPYHALSAGQQCLVLLARAMVKNPPILVLDEPYQALDKPHRQFLNELLEQLCAHTPLTLIYVTHYQDQLPSLITHTIKLNHGQVQ